MFFTRCCKFISYKQRDRLHGGLLHITNITQIFHIFVFILSILILQLTSFYPRKVLIPEYSSLNQLLFKNFIFYKNKILNKMGNHFNIIEYPLILLFIITGAVFLMSTNDLISIFLAIELQSYGLYILSTLYRDSESATSSGLTYFLLGGLSSCFILLGSTLLNNVITLKKSSIKDYSKGSVSIIKHNITLKGNAYSRRIKIFNR